jgi:hypothetical protein
MMGKYTSLQSDIFSIFASAEWKSENIKTYPRNLSPTTSTTEYIRVSIVANSNGINSNSVAGLLIIDIFTPRNIGPNRIFTIADILDGYLVNKNISLGTGHTQTGRISVLDDPKPDTANSSLCRAKYSIPFNFFGV